MKQQSQGSSRNLSWSRLVGVVLALVVLAVGSVAVASEPVVNNSADTALAQGQPADSSAPADTATPDETVEPSSERESTETAQVQPEPDHPFGHTAPIYFNRRR